MANHYMIWAYSEMGYTLLKVDIMIQTYWNHQVLSIPFLDPYQAVFNHRGSKSCTPGEHPKQHEPNHLDWNVNWQLCQIAGLNPYRAQTNASQLGCGLSYPQLSTHNELYIYMISEKKSQSLICWAIRQIASVSRQISQGLLETAAGLPDIGHFAIVL